MSTLTDLNCRICLTKCTDKDKNFKDFSQTLSNFIKFEFIEDVVPQKICSNCTKIIKSIENFHKTCKKTEKVLEKCKITKEIKTEDDFPVKIEADPPPKDALPTKPVKQKYKFCEICGKEVHISYFKVHQESHSPQKSSKNPFSCDYCGHRCFTKAAILFHIRQKHLKLINYQCKYCPQSYSTRNSLTFHTAMKHTGEFSHFCEICGKGFISASRLVTHSSIHTDLRSFVCEICKDSFKSKQYLGYHKREVHSEKTFACENCSKTFKCMKLLRQHRHFHGPNRFKCVVCPQSFSTGQTLRSHLKKNHPELPVAPPGSNLRNLSSLDCYLLLCN
ncbi:zinc finger protein 91-like [Culicoides brevitarsis]|uniref:zinc finger protein 91-like n=1 Tax=Culicoides brevitarsis TaxID=469753 RepID=UPI00307C86AB